MKRSILFILILMSLCVMGIVGLQLFWNYQNYKNTVKAFDHDINEALTKAVAQEADQRRDQIIRRFKGWLADTSLVTITADHRNRDSSTVFYTRDTHPKFKEDEKRKAQFGFTDFKEKLDHITPKAKAFMIEHFGDRILKRDLIEGTIYNYTELLGDSLTRVFNGSKADTSALRKLFSAELAAKGIRAGFTLNPAKKKQLYLTKPVNTNFRKPFVNDLVYAGLESPDSYFLKEMKWVIITSLLLITITIGCFTYTVRVLLSQQKLAELKDDFVNNMTHELNTPISSIKITAEALKSFKHSPETEKEYLDIIGYQADKLTKLTWQILNTGRLINAGETGWAVIDLNDLVAKAIRDLRPQVESNKAQISYRPLATSPKVAGEAETLLNVLINLIDNALKYTVGRPVIDLSIRIANGYAEIAVADNGIGILPEYHDKVFDKFFRVPQGNLHNVKGSGLGLCYVKQTISQHKGFVSLANNQPAGSIFTIKLPLSDG